MASKTPLQELVAKLPGYREIRQYLDQSVLKFADLAQPITAEEIAAEFHYPSLNSTRRLQDVCTRHHITTVKRLHDIGLYGLLKCRGAGERTAWIASFVLFREGYDLAEWLRADVTGIRTQQGAIRAANQKTRGRKTA